MEGCVCILKQFQRTMFPPFLPEERWQLHGTAAYGTNEVMRWEWSFEAKELTSCLDLLSDLSDARPQVVETGRV